MGKLFGQASLFSGFKNTGIFLKKNLFVFIALSAVSGIIWWMEVPFQILFLPLLKENKSSAFREVAPWRPTGSDCFVLRVKSEVASQSTWRPHEKWKDHGKQLSRADSMSPCVRSSQAPCITHFRRRKHFLPPCSAAEDSSSGMNSEGPRQFSKGLKQSFPKASTNSASPCSMVWSALLHSGRKVIYCEKASVSQTVRLFGAEQPLHWVT